MPTRPVPPTRPPTTSREPAPLDRDGAAILVDVLRRVVDPRSPGGARITPQEARMIRLLLPTLAAIAEEPVPSDTDTDTDPVPPATDDDSGSGEPTGSPISLRGMQASFVMLHADDGPGWTYDDTVIPRLDAVHRWAAERGYRLGIAPTYGALRKLLQLDPEVVRRSVAMGGRWYPRAHFRDTQRGGPNIADCAAMLRASGAQETELVASWEDEALAAYQSEIRGTTVGAATFRADCLTGWGKPSHRGEPTTRTAGVWFPMLTIAGTDANGSPVAGAGVSSIPCLDDGCPNTIAKKRGVLRQLARGDIAATVALYMGSVAAYDGPDWSVVACGTVKGHTDTDNPTGGNPIEEEVDRSIGEIRQDGNLERVVWMHPEAIIAGWLRENLPTYTVTVSAK